MADRTDRPAQYDRVRRPFGSARGQLGRALPLAQPPLGVRAVRRVGPGARAPLRRRRGGGGTPQGHRRRARPDDQPPPLPPRGTSLRGVQRGPRAHGRARRRLRPRTAGQRCRCDPQALRRERLGDRPLHGRRAGRGARLARALSARVREGRRRGARVARDELVQLHQRDDGDRERPPRDTAFDRVGLRRRRHQRLDRCALARGGRGAPGPRDARPRRSVGRCARRRGAGRTHLRGPRGREGAPHPAPRGPRRRARRHHGRPVRDLEDGVAFIREAAAEGMVLLRNENELPWDGAALRRVAVIGNNAAFARTQGGGSATVVPSTSSPPSRGSVPRSRVPRSPSPWGL